MCAPYLTGIDISVMVVDTYGVKNHNLACKIVHQNELITTINRNPKTIELTILSNTILTTVVFLTAQPNLLEYYGVFLMQVLPCPNRFAE